MLAISLTIACSRYTYNGVILHAHPVRGESYNQGNTTGEVATVSKIFVKAVCIFMTNKTAARIENILVSCTLN